MLTKSYTKSQNWLNHLCIILLLIPRPIHIITLEFVFQAIPEPKLRCSRLKFKAFQVYSKPFQVLFQVCSKFDFPFCLSFFQKLNLLEHFSKSLIQVREKLHQNYTRITPKLTWNGSETPLLINSSSL